ncbi:hypothetical protein KKP06_22000 [Ralstonia pickettii]|uniref:hypothetical protein n=1 Tax=Ralstonia pickettii TaxID=329 RepID=UPI001BE3EC3C|nr:hypothetical protein [Ralstonia pickettii]MBT2180492.1 hypothetical protein [Ralstonia pickettii]
MIRTTTQIKLMALGLPPVPCNLGGDSSSQANTTNNNIDQKLYTDNGSVAGSASGGGSVTINAQQVDHGATQAAFGLGNHALDAVTSLATGALSGSQHTAEQALSGQLATIKGSQDAMNAATRAIADAYRSANSSIASAYSGAASDSASAYRSASDSVSAAYQDSKTGNQRVIVIGALVVVGIVALAPLLKKAA